MTKNEAILRSITRWEGNVRLLKEHIGKRYLYSPECVEVQRNKIYIIGNNFDPIVSDGFDQVISFDDDEFCKYSKSLCHKCPGFIANGYYCNLSGPEPWSKFIHLIRAEPRIITKKHIDAAQEVLDWVAKAKELMEDAL